MVVAGDKTQRVLGSSDAIWPRQPSPFCPPLTPRQSAIEMSLQVGCGQNSARFCPTPQEWFWTQLGTRHSIRVFKEHWQHFSQTKQNRTRMNADLADDHRLSSPLFGITLYATDYLSSADLIRENPFNLCSSAFYFLSWLKRYEHRTTCSPIIATHAEKASSIFGRPAALPPSRIATQCKAPR